MKLIRKNNQNQSIKVKYTAIIMTKFDLNKNKQSTSTLFDHFKYITSDTLTLNVSSLFFC